MQQTKLVQLWESVAGERMVGEKLTPGEALAIPMKKVTHGVALLPGLGRTQKESLTAQKTERCS